MAVSVHKWLLNKFRDINHSRMDIDQDTLAERIRQLECLTAEKDVNIAVGVTWQDRADTHLDELLQEAEKRMYEDKAEYYKKTGIERRGADKKG